MNKKHTLVTNSESGLVSEYVQCRTAVKKSAIRHESIDGIEHIIIESSTLPDDIVMNGRLYPADVIESTYQTLELTFAPVEHPNIDGVDVSAYDPRAVHKYDAGAYNMNVRRKDGRVWVDKYINVQQAQKSDRGKHLLDRINELETSDSPRPIHTSIGAFLDVELLAEPVRNAQGIEYGSVVKDMLIDHDAILLESTGAATPEQGVGLALNKKGEKVKLYCCSIDDIENNKDMSFSEIHESLYQVLKDINEFYYISEVYPDVVIYRTEDKHYRSSYEIDADGNATLTGEREEVEIQYVKVNKEEDQMKELIINKLKKAGVKTDGLSDDQLFSEYNKLVLNEQKQEDKPAGDKDKPTGDQGNPTGDTGTAALIANAITEAMKPISEKIDSVEQKLGNSEQKEIDDLAGIVVNSGKYAGLSLESAKLLKKEDLKTMAANVQPAFGLPSMVNNGESGDVVKFTAPTEMVK